MQTIINLLQQTRNKSISDLQTKQKQSLAKFREVADGISQSYKSGGFSAFSIVDLDSELLPHQEESTILPPFVRVGSLTPVNAGESEKEKMTVPFLFPYSQVNATTFLLSEDDAKNIHINFSPSLEIADNYDANYCIPNNQKLWQLTEQMQNTDLIYLRDNNANFEQQLEIARRNYNG